MSRAGVAVEGVTGAPRGPSGWCEAWPLRPALAFLLVLFVWRVGEVLGLRGVERSGGLTGQECARLFASSLYVDVLLITVKISAWATAFALLGGYPVAYLLATSDARWRSRLTFWVLLPFWTSFLVRAFAWMVLLGRNGALNKLLEATGLTSAPVAVIFNLTGVLIGMTHALMPLGILTMVAVMEPLDANPPNAAPTPGARSGRTLFPLLPL